MKPTNDPIFHHATWLPIPSKIPSHISKFEGKLSEHLGNHIMAFHVWCSSNTIK